LKASVVIGVVMVSNDLRWAGGFALSASDSPASEVACDRAYIEMMPVEDL
jgi:hypothetical protein